MPDRRPFAAGVPPLLALLAALLLNWSVAAAQAPDPLTLTLTAERSECTAGTLNPVSWEITGGVEPYRLTVDGAPVDADAESATVTCGTLPDGATEAPATIAASVTDAAGTTVTASAAYTIVLPLPAPVASAVPSGVLRFFVGIEWSGLTVPASCDMPTGCYASRSRLAGETRWDYGWDQHENAEWDWPVGVGRSVAAAGTTVEAGIASMRHPIEIETPEALAWSATVQATSLTDISGLTATSTHDTLTVRWNRQPSADGWDIGIAGPRGGEAKTIAPRGPAEWVAGWGDPTSATHEVTFTDLPSDTEYVVVVWGSSIPEAGPTHAVEATTTVRTAVAPPDYTPLVRGPQNLRATATHDTITVRWDHPRPDTEDHYWLRLSGPPGSVPIGYRDEHVFPPASVYTYTDLAPATTYHIRVTQWDITSESAEITITTKAAPPPLRLTLTSSRDVCTANTLTELTWAISGGKTPYTLTIDGETVDLTAESHKANCGPLATDPVTGDPLPNQTKTFTATVTDARGVTAVGVDSVDLAEPLPAPTRVGAQAFRTAFQAVWDRVAVAGAVPTDSADCPCPLYFLRWRVTDTDTWASEIYADRGSASQPGTAYYVNGVREGTAYQLSIATLRDVIEQETPAALAWSAPVTMTTVAPATGVRAIATHDTITVTWETQAGAKRYSIGVSGPRGSTFQRFTPDGDTPHRVIFRHLEPGTAYTVDVGVEVGAQSPVTEITASTTAAPSDWTPLPRGPQNLRTTVTHNSVTVDWDAPYTGARNLYTVSLFQSEEEVGYRIVSGDEGTSHAFTDLVPSTWYRVKVTHAGIVMEDAEVTVTTATAPAAGSASLGLTCFEYLVGAVICTWPADAPSLQ